MRGRSESRASGDAAAARAGTRLIDRAARGAAAGMTRRDLVRLGAGAAVAAALPAAAWPTAAPAAKQRGTCATRPRGTCPPGTTPGKWRAGAAQTIDSGVASTFNGCGPESGIRLPVFGKTDPVPDRPLLLANFFEGCKAHDCCYGTCGSDQAQCDRAFLEQGLEACARTHVGRGEIEKGLRLACNKVAQLYHFAVSSGGRAAWEAAQETACLSCQRCDADLMNDPQNCGSCGHRCAPGLACCGGDCKDTSVDDQNCGACGNVCPAGTRCIGGACVARCERGQTPCGTTCCDAGEVCGADGVCRRPQRCEPGYEDCNGECCRSGFCIDGRCASNCDGTPCPSDRECCFRTRESPDRGVCCPAGTTCYGHPSGFTSCKPL